MKKWSVAFLSLLLVFTLFAELIHPVDPEHGHWWNKIPGFFIVFGLLGCVFLIYLAKAIGKYWLTRDEDYYDDK